MLFQFLMFADFLSFIIAILTSFEILNSWRIAAWAAVYLLGKAFVFRDAMSIIDGSIGVYLILVAFGLHFWFVYFVIAYTIYKFISILT